MHFQQLFRASVPWLAVCALVFALPAGAQYHSADGNGDFVVGETELLRTILLASLNTILE